jgi:hypothetical protein
LLFSLEAGIGAEKLSAQRELGSDFSGVFDLDKMNRDLRVTLS